MAHRLEFFDGAYVTKVYVYISLGQVLLNSCYPCHRGLPGFLFTGLNASLKDCLAGVSGFKRIICPSHDSRRRSVTMLQGSHFVTSNSCWFVMTRGYFIPRAYRSCRRWKESMLSFMVLVGVHSSQLYRKIMHSANTLKCRIF